MKTFLALTFGLGGMALGIIGLFVPFDCADEALVRFTLQCAGLGAMLLALAFLFARELEA